MPDRYIELATLGARLLDVKAQLDKLVAEKSDLVAQMDKLAAELTAARGAPSLMAAFNNQFETARSGEAQTGSSDRGMRLHPRHKQVLRLLKANPGEGYKFFANQMFADREYSKAYSSLSALFSELKTSGHIDSDGRGKFWITDKGKESIEDEIPFRTRKENAQ
jgi:hypothetical protein